MQTGPDSNLIDFENNFFLFFAKKFKILLKVWKYFPIRFGLIWLIIIFLITICYCFYFNLKTKSRQNNKGKKSNGT